VILVDSSVWISYLNILRTKESEFLDQVLGKISVVVPDLIYCEILQGYRNDRAFKETRGFLDEFPIVILGGKELAIKSAQNYRQLRKKGITVRKTIDCYIATYCIEKDLTLLHSDRDFEPFAVHLGLRSVF
jgi:predicted nucleic acid-binding protein